MGRRIENLIGKKFGKLRAIHPERINGKIKWLCECECGQLIYVRTAELTSGRVKSCGCSKYKFSPEAKVKLRQNAKHARECRKINSTAGSILGVTKRQRKSLSGVTGVYWNKHAKKWYATIMLYGKSHYLGSFNTVAEAADARLAAEKKYFWPIMRKYKREREKIKNENHERWLAGKEDRKKELERYQQNMEHLKKANSVSKVNRDERRKKEIDEQLKQDKVKRENNLQ